MTPQARRLASPDALWIWTVRLHRRADLLCAVVVAAGVLAWWGWVDLARVRPVAARPDAARMRWLDARPASDASAWHTDVRAISSPLLFALPTPLGFSRDALAPSGLKPPPPVATVAPMSPYLIAPSDVIARLERSDLLDQVPLNRLAPWPEPVSSASTVTRTDGAVILAGTLAGRAPVSKLITLGTNQPALLDQPWEAVAQVRVDADGWIDHVLLEKPTASTNRNAAVVRLLRGVNLGRGGVAEGRVALRYEGRPAGAAP